MTAGIGRGVSTGSGGERAEGQGQIVLDVRVRVDYIP
jgi:hypothetical protein